MPNEHLGGKQLVLILHSVGAKGLGEGTKTQRIVVLKLALGLDTLGCCAYFPPHTLPFFLLSGAPCHPQVRDRGLGTDLLSQF